MRVFISWSGRKSRGVAEQLRSWLPLVLPSVRGFVSSEDIAKGQRWSGTIATELRESQFGLLVVTRENASSLWLHFEAGALTNRFEQAAVCPLLVDLRPSDLVPPLSQFQCATTEPEDLRRLVHAMNEVSPPGERIDAARLDHLFDVLSPELIRDIAEITSQEESAAAPVEPSPVSAAEEFLGENYVMNSEQFQSAIARCSQLRILGFTQNRMLATYSRELQDICDRGGSISMLVLAPDSEAVLLANERSYVPKPADDIRYQHRAALAILRSISSSSTTGQVNVKGIDMIPPFTIFIFGFEDEHEDECYVWMMPWKQPSRSRPGFRLRRAVDTHWYAFFDEQFNTIWTWDRAIPLLHEAGERGA